MHFASVILDGMNEPDEEDEEEHQKSILGAMKGRLMF